MSDQPAASQAPAKNPWLPWFVLSIAVLCCSLVALVWVLLDAISDGATREPGEVLSPGDGTSTAVPVLEGKLTYGGPLPRNAAALDLEVAAEGKSPDFVFAIGDAEGSVITRYFVPVTALGAGVDALSLDELREVLSGEIDDWEDAGGVPGEVRIRFVDVPGDAAVVRSWLGAESGELPERVEALPDYASLRAELAVDSGIIAFVPLDELHPSMVAIAVGGDDIARGSGDPAAWPFVERFTVEANTNRGRDQLDDLKALVAAPLPEVTTVVATGDVLQSRCSLAAIEASGDWGAALRGPVGEYLAAADLTLSSLDGSIQDIGEAARCIVMEFPNLTSPPEVIEALTLAGIDGMTVATNHAFDCGDAGCGSEAMLQSIARLNAVGIKTVGGGNNLEEALTPAIFEVNGIRFGVLGFDDIAAEDIGATETEPGTAPLDDSYEDERTTPPDEPAFYAPAEMLDVTRLEERIRALKANVDVVIVQIQSGTEDTHTPSPRSLKGLRAAAAAGADLVVGNQAHWVQAIEVQGDTFIAYALGNFIFDQTRTPEHTQGYLLEATFHGKRLVTVRLVPYEIEDRYKPVFVDGNLRAKILGDVAEASAELPAR